MTIKCPECNCNMDCVLSKKDKSLFQFECINCLIWWELKRYDMSNGEIRELTQQ